MKYNKDKTITIGRLAQHGKMSVGVDHPLRLVVPFGTSGQADLNTSYEELLNHAIQAGANAVQEVSTFGPFSQTRKRLTRSITVPYGTVLAYEALWECQNQRALSSAIIEKIILTTLERQILQGVDYITVHASLTKHLLQKTNIARSQRAIPIPSRAGQMLLSLMHKGACDNPLHTMFPRIAHICACEGVAISLGASLRPAAISDAMDSAHIAEIQEQSKLVETAHGIGTQVMLEGFSHGLPKDIEHYCCYSRQTCQGIPITALGPLPIDIATGADHIAAAIGVMFSSLFGISLINVITAKEHVSMPCITDTIEAIRAAKIGAYTAEAIRAGKIAKRDRLMSEARASLKWTQQRQHVLFQNLFDSLLSKENLHDNQSCGMCKSKCPLLTASANK